MRIQTNKINHSIKKTAPIKTHRLKEIPRQGIKFLLQTNCFAPPGPPLILWSKKLDIGVFN